MKGSQSPEERYRKYGEKFWMKEYVRFGRVFVKQWLSHARNGPWGTNKKMIASLPGNHDLGLGTGIQLPVRKRFNAFFGDGNRVDVIGNHTFVSVDTVSLSAKGQPGGSPEEQQQQEMIWKPAAEFLDGVQETRRRAVNQELVRRKLRERRRFDHTMIKHPQKTDEHSSEHIEKLEKRTTPEERMDFPTILLTHVPLYRAPGTPCGPLREHWPPQARSSSSSSSSSSSDPIKDEANAIPIRAGYQYQNVLTPEITNDLINRVGPSSSSKYPNMRVFSGDDHDYCDIIHHDPDLGQVRETTVKSISYAMGVRRPGFLLVSLWNPVIGDHHDKHNDPPTMESSLCLLPDQISIFKVYSLALVLTLAVMFLYPPLRLFYDHLSSRHQPDPGRQEGYGHVLRRRRPSDDDEEEDDDEEGGGDKYAPRPSSHQYAHHQRTEKEKSQAIRGLQRIAIVGMAWYVYLWIYS